MNQLTPPKNEIVWVQYLHNGVPVYAITSTEDIYNDLLKLTNPYRDKNKITLSIDPSAASFIHYVKQHNDFKLSIYKSLYNTKNIKTQGRKITND